MDEQTEHATGAGAATSTAEVYVSGAITAVQDGAPMTSLEEARHLPERQVAALLLGTARERVGLAADADAGVIGQWLVTELIAPPTRALQLHLFQGSGDRAGRHE